MTSSRSAVGELAEQRRDRVGVVEELAAVADRRDCRRDRCGDGQAVGVAQQALQVLPLALALLPLLVGGPPAFEVGAEAVVVVGDGAEPLVAAERQ